ncbi:hypothetical protein AOX59_00250 [Lentibacillus amyloliquefaciens]|uniref:Uncharacterized protein n=1 Tax=Lentibacillus amyloliquefaciens TaxID=1472767 RepID=A0A0U4FER2_9BACI|nr:hypothetical protein AOX59_00250 [Lentibacillus amyloliquefaciens]
MLAQELHSRLLRESEDDETPQRAFFASEEAQREPAESWSVLPERYYSTLSNAVVNEQQSLRKKPSKSTF